MSGKLCNKTEGARYVYYELIYPNSDHTSWEDLTPADRSYYISVFAEALERASDGRMWSYE